MLNISNGGNGIVEVSIAHCPNITRLIREYLASLAAAANSTATVDGGSESSAAEAAASEALSQRNAVVYIVVVLLFYSFGIGIMMIKYMRKEASEQEEFKMYRRYMGGRDASDQRLHDPTDRARLSNRLALQALNMVNVIPQTSQAGGKVTFV